METSRKETSLDPECRWNFNNSSNDLKKMDLKNNWTKMNQIWFQNKASVVKVMKPLIPKHENII